MLDNDVKYLDFNIILPSKSYETTRDVTLVRNYSFINIFEIRAICSFQVKSINISSCFFSILFTLCWCKTGGLTL